MTRMSEDQLTALLARTGAKGKPNTADTSSVPFIAGHEVVINLPLCPSTNHLFKNIGRGRARTPEYNAWIKEAGARLALQRPPKVQGRVSLLIEVSESETPASADVANREKAATDLLVTMGVIEGDSKRFVRRICMQWAEIQGMKITIWGGS
jgi:Holliday junction resolvase RusA-like endonuclease